MPHIYRSQSVTRITSTDEYDWVARISKENGLGEIPIAITSTRHALLDGRWALTDPSEVDRMDGFSRLMIQSGRRPDPAPGLMVGVGKWR